MRGVYPGVFVGGLLVLLGHRPGQGLAEQVDNVEDGTRSRNELDDLGEDPETLTLGSLGTGAVRTESNPVGYQITLSAPTPTKRRKKNFSRYQDHIPAFFSCTVIWCQSTFIRSRSCIHRSACSWGGMASQRFSMPERVGFAMACSDEARVC